MPFARWFSLSLVLLCGTAIAAQWKPFCIEGSSCSRPYDVKLGGGWQGYHPIDRHAAGPLVTRQGILLHHTPLEFPIRDRTKQSVRHIFQLSTSGRENFGGGFGYVSDANATQSLSGRIFSFRMAGFLSWIDPDEVTGFNWSGKTHVIDFNNGEYTGPPVTVGNSIFAGLLTGGYAVYMSPDDGNTWIARRFDVRIGTDRFNLMENPEKNELWFIQSEFFDFPATLWETTNNGFCCQRVDNGSFPANTVRVVHDPADQLVSYALTDHGLFISVDRGVFWIRSALIEAIHGLVFIERKAPLPRALIAGTDSGVKLSLDEGKTWANMSKGLLAMPHTVTYGHGQLIATSDAGYFTCNAIDCAGLSQPLPPVEERGLVEVIEFYNADLDHYFISSYQAEVDAIDQGVIPGWIRTGESFMAWSVGSDVGAVDVCRFYGSMSPGPNSHFFTLSTGECSFLLNLQETSPADKPRWNFEAYAFSLMPPIQDEQQSCKENFIPVYRAYNNGSNRGIDSNHRYVTDLAQLTPLLAGGWIREGVAFCSPDGTSSE